MAPLSCTRRIRDSLLHVRSFDEREVLLDLLQRPARTHQAQQMLHRKPVTPDTRLAAHLPRLNRDPVKDAHGHSAYWPTTPATPVPTWRTRERP